MTKVGKKGVQMEDDAEWVFARSSLLFQRASFSTETNFLHHLTCFLAIVTSCKSAVSLIIFFQTSLHSLHYTNCKISTLSCIITKNEQLCHFRGNIVIKEIVLADFFEVFASKLRMGKNRKHIYCNTKLMMTMPSALHYEGNTVFLRQAYNILSTGANLYIFFFKIENLMASKYIQKIQNI